MKTIIQKPWGKEDAILMPFYDWNRNEDVKIWHLPQKIILDCLLFIGKYCLLKVMLAKIMDLACVQDVHLLFLFGSK